MNWDTSCPDWEERLLSGRSLVPDLPLFREESALALRNFKRLKIPDIRGRPRIGEAAGPWLFPMVEAIFGSYDVNADIRMIQEHFWLIPKKNFKTGASAAVGVTALIMNRRPEAEYDIVSTTKTVAGRCFKQAADTIRCDEELIKLFQIQTHIRTITNRRTGASLKVVAADTDAVTGGKQVGTIIDEIHELGAKPNAMEVMVELRGALTARPDGFILTITTQSKKQPQGLFKDELQRARDVRDGLLKLPLLPVLYELPERLSKDDGWKNRKFWPLVNPNFGRSVRIDFLERELLAAEASDQRAEKLQLLASQHFNVEVGTAMRAGNWAGARYWDNQARPRFTLAELIEASDVVTVGADGGGLDDLLGFCALGRDKDDPNLWRAFSFAWVHRGVIEATDREPEEAPEGEGDDAESSERKKKKAVRKQLAAKFHDLEKAGDLKIVATMREAFVELADMVEEINEAGKLAQVGVDPAGVGEIVDELDKRAITEDGGQVIGVPQGFRLNGVIKSTEGRLSDGLLIHGGQLLMVWCVGNAKVEQKGNAILITKQASGVGKIDPVMALLNAVSRMLDQPEAKSSVYTAERGLLVFG